MLSHLRATLVTFAFMIVLTGLLYPLGITAVVQLAWPQAAHGSLLTDAQGVTRGSALLAQNFARPEYFHSRPSAAGNGYDATASSGSNDAPTSRKLIAAVRERVAAARADGSSGAVPADLVTSSASGLDPHLSPAAAEWQVPRVARARGMSKADLRALVTHMTEGPAFGFIGPPHVNVMLLNQALDARHPVAPP